MQSKGGFNLFKLHKTDAGIFVIEIDKKSMELLCKTDDGSLCMDLIEEMCYQDQKYRTSADMVLKHAYFWNSLKKLEFLKDLKSILYSEKSENISKIQDALNFDSGMIGDDWSKKLDDLLVKDIEKKRYFKLDCVTDLINYIPMKNQHVKESQSGNAYNKDVH